MKKLKDLYNLLHINIIDNIYITNNSDTDIIYQLTDGFITYYNITLSF